MKSEIKYPLVSIITPVYNGVDYIEDLILSVSNQDYPNIEHIIIDDGSSDNGATIGVLQRYPNLRWWTRENKGQYATMNEGLSAAKGDWVCFISADDLIAPEAVRTVIDFIFIHPECDAVYGKSQLINKNGVHYEVQNLLHQTPLWLYKFLPQIHHCSFYVRRNVLLEGNYLFDENLHYIGDYDWILRLINAKFRFGFVNRVLSKIRIHPGQTSIQQEKEMSAEKRMAH
ncbi:MAG: glycosyltransferase, partial [Anaerolineaceae bacterium]|nr:glycosyltransferase [Anaerolineaceae bacterium]